MKTDPTAAQLLAQAGITATTTRIEARQLLYRHVPGRLRRKARVAYEQLRAQPTGSVPPTERAPRPKES